MSMNGDPATPTTSTPPPPMIGKIGPYTVFVTPPATPKPKFSSPQQQQSPLSSPHSPSPNKINPYPPPQSPVQSPPPVLPPPIHYHSKSDSSPFAFFWNAVTKVQNAHSSLDGYVAHWFGLNQSKYQWALDDYYESKGGMDQVDAKTKEMPSKTQSV